MIRLILKLSLSLCYNTESVHPKWLYMLSWKVRFILVNQFAKNVSLSLSFVALESLINANESVCNKQLFHSHV